MASFCFGLQRRPRSWPKSSPLLSLLLVINILWSPPIFPVLTKGRCDGLLKSIRRLLGQAPRRGESRAWRSLKKPCGFKSQMFIQDLPQAGWPRTSSVVPLSQNLKGESWYSNNRGVRRSARLALLRIGSGALKLPRLCGPACWPARRQPRWIAAMSAAILPSLPTRPSRTPDAAYNCTNRRRRFLSPHLRIPNKLA